MKTHDQGRAEPRTGMTAVNDAVNDKQTKAPEDAVAKGETGERPAPETLASTTYVQEPPVAVAEVVTAAPAAVAEVKQVDESTLTPEQQQMVADLRARLAAASQRGTRRIASGSKARPNVKYRLLAKPPAWHNTPQVAQLQHIMFNPEVLAKYAVPEGTKYDSKEVKAEIPEPELFALIEAGKVAGTLRTRQPAVRILQYYRNELLNAGCLRWE